MRRSRVMSVAFVTRAVATISRSAGSRWNVSGSNDASTATCGNKGSIDRPGADTASVIHCANGRLRATRPRDAKSAASQTDIAAILSWPEAAARLITPCSLIANSGFASINQSHTCVSSSSGRGSDVLVIAGPPRIFDRTDDVAADLGCPRHVAKQFYRFLLYRHQLGDRLAPLGD